MSDTAAQSKGGEGKNQTVPLASLLEAKRALKRAEEENARLKNTLKLVNLEDVTDSDVRDVKALLLKEHEENESLRKQLEEQEDKLTVRESAIKERDAADLVQSLVAKYAPKVDGESKESKKAHEAFIEAIKKSEDPEKEALKLYAERLNEGKESKPSAEDVFDSTKAGGKIAKSPLDMNPEELKAFRESHMAKV